MDTLRGALECVDIATGELHRPEHVQALIEGVAQRIESLAVGECAKLAKYLRNRAPGLVLAQKERVAPARGVGRAVVGAGGELGVPVLVLGPGAAQASCARPASCAVSSSARRLRGTARPTWRGERIAARGRRGGAAPAPSRLECHRGVQCGTTPLSLCAQRCNPGLSRPVPCLVQSAHAALGTAQGDQCSRVPDRTAGPRLAHAARLSALADTALIHGRCRARALLGHPPTPSTACLGTGPTRVCKDESPHFDRCLANWHSAHLHNRTDQKTIIEHMRRLANTWENQASQLPPANLSLDEWARADAAEHNTTLSITPTLADPFAKLETLLLNQAPEVLFVLGGGSALQMRYDHRDSTDIDLFYPQNKVPTVARLARRGLWKSLFGATLATNPGQAAALAAVDDTEVTVYPTESLPTDCSCQPIEGHRTLAQPTRYILHGKLMRTGSEPDDLAIRDLYDLTIAARLEPDAMAHALGRIRATTNLTPTIIHNLKTASRNLHDEDPKPIIDPRYDLELEGLASRLVPLVETGNPACAPQTVRHDAPYHPLGYQHGGPER